MVLESMSMGVSIGDNSLIGPRMIGGFAFSQYKGSDSTWSHFPRAQFHLPECLATLTDDGAWLTISRLVRPDDTVENLSEDYKPTYPMVIKLSDNDARIIKETYEVARKASDHQTMLKLKSKIEEVTGIQSVHSNTHAFVKTVLKDYNYFTQHM